MKKPITLIILLALTVVAVSPITFGFWAEAKMNGILEKMSESEVLDFAVIQQERGWFSSTYDIAVEVSGEASEAYREYLMNTSQQSGQQDAHQGTSGDEVQPFTVVIRNVINHGPFPADGFPGGNFSLIPVIATIDTEVISVSGGDNDDNAFEFSVPYSVRSLISLTGNTMSIVNIEPWNGVPEEGKALIDWEGLNAEFRYDVIDGKVTGKINMPSLSAHRDAEKVLLSNIHIDMEITESIQSISLGEMRFRVGAIKFDNQLDAGKNLSIENCEFAVISELSDGNINSTMDLIIERLQSGKRSFGPGKYQLRLNNLDAESLREIDRQVKELQRQGIPREQAGMMMVANMFSILPDLLAKGPSLEISSLSLESDYGLLQGRGKVSIDTSNEAVLKNPLLLQEAIIADLEFVIPEELLVLFKIIEVKNDMSMSGVVKSNDVIESSAREMVKNEMDILVRQNIFIREDGNRYRIRASFIEGKLSVNGTEFNLPAMKKRQEQPPRSQVQ